MDGAIFLGLGASTHRSIDSHGDCTLSTFHWTFLLMPNAKRIDSFDPSGELGSLPPTKTTHLFGIASDDIQIQPPIPTWNQQN